MKFFNSTKSLKSKQKGFTLVELGVVVAVGATILVISLGVVPSVLANNRANAEMQEVPGIATNIQKIYLNAPTYVGATLDAVIRLNAFPSSRVTIPASGAATATNRWGGAVTMSVATLTSTNDIVRLVYSNVGSSECKTVIGGIAGLARRIVVDSANSGTSGAGTTVKPDAGALDITALGTACGTTANSITYDIGK